MSDQSTRGVSKAIAGILQTMKPHDQIMSTPEVLATVRKTVPKATQDSVSYSLRYLCQRGVLAPTKIAGCYAKPNGKAMQPDADVEEVVIDNLLAAMAAAEPVLRKCKTVMAALKNIK